MIDVDRRQHDVAAAGALHPIEPGVGDVDLTQSHVERVSQRDCISGGVLDCAARAVAVEQAARGRTVAGDGQPAARAGVVEHDAAGRIGRRVVPDEMLWNVRSAAPIVVLATLSAVPVVEVMVLPEPCTVTVPPPVALKPVPLVVVMSRPLPPAALKLMVAPVLLRQVDGRVGAGAQRGLAVEVDGAAGVAVDVDAVGDAGVRGEVAGQRDGAAGATGDLDDGAAAVVLVIAAAMVTLPAPPLMSTPLPPGSLVLPIVPPLMVTEPAELVMSMPSPV